MTNEPEPRLAKYLRATRARLTPERAGVVATGRRNVEGLRREELAVLAGVSVDYYTRLEQGRSKTASPVVLDALADAFQLDETERVHLHTIARPTPSRRRRVSKPQHVSSATRSLLDTFNKDLRPAFLLGRRLDILGQNALAAQLIGDFATLPVNERNQARFVFREPHARELYKDWDEVAADTAAMLRVDAGKHPHDPMLSQLIGELSIHSTKFRQLWAHHRVHQRTTGTKHYHHPLVGDLTITYQALILADDANQTLLVYDTEIDSPSSHGLKLLASKAAEHADAHTVGRGGA